MYLVTVYGYDLSKHTYRVYDLEAALQFIEEIHAERGGRHRGFGLRRLEG